MTGRRRMREIEEKFFNKHMNFALKEYQNQVLTYLMTHSEELRQQILKSLSMLGASLSEDIKVGYICFSLLQVGFLNESYEVLIEAYGEKSYLESLGSVSFFLKDVFEGLDVLKKQWQMAIKPYVGKVRVCSLEHYILKQLNIYNEYFTYFMMKWLRNWDEEESFQAFYKAPVLRINWGGYKDDVHLVYVYEVKQKEQEDLKKTMIQGENLIFSQWQSIKLDDFKIECKDLTGINFKDAQLKNINIVTCLMPYANFRKATLNNSYFESCDLRLVDFTESVLENVTFKDCILDKSDFEKATFKQVKIIEGEKIILSNGIKE